jgi:hypothetical protein
MKTWRRNYSEAAADFGNSGNDYSGSPTLPFLDFAIDEIQETRRWAAHHHPAHNGVGYGIGIGAAPDEPSPGGDS